MMCPTAGVCSQFWCFPSFWRWVTKGTLLTGTSFNYFPCSFYFPMQENKTVCPVGEVERKAAQLIGK